MSLLTLLLSGLGRSPFASSLVGGDSPAENPTGFLRAIFGLFDRYLLRCATTASCPLIINTQGWVKGLGYVLLLDVLRYCAPSVVVQIEAGVFKKDLPELVPLPEGSVFVGDFPAALKTNPAVFSWLHHPEIFKVASVTSFKVDIGTSVPSLAAATVVPGDSAVVVRQPPQQQQKKHPSLGAKDLRTLSLMAYFCQQQTVDGLCVPLSMQQPYSVSWDLVDIKFPSAPVAAGNVLQALNSSVVALLRDARSVPTRTTKAGGVGVAAACSAMECLGYGVIRSVDAERRVFYINTPVPVASLRTVTVLAKVRAKRPNAIPLPAFHPPRRCYLADLSECEFVATPGHMASCPASIMPLSPQIGSLPLPPPRIPILSSPSAFNGLNNSSGLDPCLHVS